VRRFRQALDEHGLVVPMATTNLFTDPVFKDGAFTSADARVRNYALAKTMRAIDLGVELGARTYVFWGGREGAEVDAGGKLLDALQWLRDAIDYLADYAVDQGYDLRFALEPKPNEPRGHAFLPTVGSALGFIATLARPEMVGVNPELAHETMAGLSFPHALAAALDAGKLFHVDLNDQLMGRFDQDLRFGAENLKTAFFTVMLLEEGGYDGPATSTPTPCGPRTRPACGRSPRAACARTRCWPRRSKRFRADPEIAAALAAYRVDDPEGAWPPRYAADHAAALKGRPSTSRRCAAAGRGSSGSTSSRSRSSWAPGERPVARDLALGVDVGTSGVGVVALDAQGRAVARADHPVALLTPRPAGPSRSRRPGCGRRGRPARRGRRGRRRPRRRHRPLGADARDGGPRRADRVVRPALLWNDQRTGRRRRRDRGGGRPHPPDRAHRQPGDHRLPAPQGRVAAPARARGLRPHRPGAAAEGPRRLPPHRRGRGGALGRLRHRRLPPRQRRLGRGGPGGARPRPGLWPRLVRSDEVVGGLLASVAERVGLRAGTPVVAGAGDNAGAATGLALGRAHPEVGSVSLGTSGVLFAALDAPTPDPAGRVHLFAHADGGFNLLGVTLSAGGSLRWYRDVFAPGAPSTT
jgi:xylose isomerase